MQKVTLQIPMNRKIKDDAERVALDYGFSSLQEILRVFMQKLALKKVNLNFEEEVVYLSPKNERRFNKITQDIESGKEKVYTTKNVDDLMKQLRIDKHIE